MDIKDPVPVPGYDRRPHSLHVPGEDDEIDAEVVEGVEDVAVKIRVRFKLRPADVESCYSVLPGRLQGARPGVVADDADDPRAFYLARPDCLQDRLEVRTPPRGENGNLQLIVHMFL